jgi:hypothetical protein
VVKAAEKDKQSSTPFRMQVVMSNDYTSINKYASLFINKPVRKLETACQHNIYALNCIELH